MKLRIAGVVVGVLIALGIIGAGTIWAQGGRLFSTPAATNCDQYMQALAQHLGVTVDKLSQAAKDAAKDLIDQAVSLGRLTPDQASEAKRRIDQARGNCGFGGFHAPTF